MILEESSAEDDLEPETRNSVVSTTPGITWDNITYKNIFKFNHGLERSEVEIEET